VISAVSIVIVAVAAVPAVAVIVVAIWTIFGAAISGSCEGCGRRRICWDKQSRALNLQCWAVVTFITAWPLL
jgi:hypothetical protein